MAPHMEVDLVFTSDLHSDSGSPDESWGSQGLTGRAGSFQSSGKQQRICMFVNEAVSISESQW